MQRVMSLWRRVCILILVFVLLGEYVNGASLKGSIKQPNFVFILADDCTYNLLGCYGGKNVKTPHIDSLAREGMRFTQAYAATAMCAPFRAELYTGRYPVRNGVVWNHGRTKDDTPSVCHYLNELGYRVGIAGKKHIKPKAVYPFVDVNGFPAGQGVRRFMTQSTDQPFCLFLCSNSPHAPWTRGDASQFDATHIDLAPKQHDNPATREVMTRYLAEVGDLDREVGEILALLDGSGQAGNTLLMFSSEQGWPLGFAKWTNWNMGLHTALIVHPI
jgi:N-sulfoglucosamine sulfohydrolase